MAGGFVRLGRVDDAVAVASVQLAAWRHASPRVIPADALEEVDEDWVRDRWTAAVTEPPTPRHRVLVAVEQASHTTVVGFAAIGPADGDVLAPGEDPWAFADPDPPNPGAGPLAALAELAVEPRWVRRGHGSRLLAAAVDLWREDGFGRAVTWAFAADPATRGLLTATGWEPDGATRALDMPGALVDQIRFEVDLTPEPPAPASAPIPADPS